MEIFSAMQGVVLVSQRLVLLEECSPCPPHCRAEWISLLTRPSLSHQTLLRKRGYQSWCREGVYFQVIIFSISFKIVQIRQLNLFVSLSCAPTHETTSSSFSCVPCVLEVTEIRGKWLIKISCLRDKSNLQAGGEILCEFIVFSKTRSFRIRFTESGPKSRLHWIWHWKLTQSCCLSVE